MRDRTTSRSKLAIASAIAAALLAAIPLTASRVSARRESRHRASVLEGLDCSACHTTDGWALSNTAGARGFDHARTGFPLTGEHKKTVCTGCHASKVRVRRDCFSCHADRHRGRLGLQCDACHDARSWTETRAIRRHRLTRLPLTGVHAILDCTSCHIRRNERELMPVPADCFACHADDYNNPSTHPNHRGDPNDPTVPPLPRDCAQCHRANGWTPAVVDPSTFRSSLARQARDHDRVFALSFGKHRGAACRSCHRSSRNRRVVSCNGCHAHRSATLRRQHGRPVSSRSASRCLSCHPRGLAR